jgi:hypothetical protein
MAITSLLIVLVLLVIGGLTYFEFQTFTVSAASVQFGPQTHLINQVFQITAKPTASTLDVNTRSMAAKVLSMTKSDTQTGPTTGETNCVFGIFGCQQSVDVADVSNLAAQIRPGLVSQINQDLEKQIANIGAHAVGSIHIADLSEVADPPVGTPSKTVAVTLKVQGSIEYIVNADAESLARQLLTKQVEALGPNYVLLNPTMRIGQPVVEAVDDTTGNVTIKIAAGGVAEYVFPSAQLQGLSDLLKGKTVNAATALLAQQPGIDKSTIAIHFTSGKGPKLPNDVQHIRIIPLTPTSLPVVNLQAVPMPVSNTSP